MKVEYIQDQDINQIQMYGELCFKNMELGQLGLSYSEVSHKDNLLRYINTDNYVALKVVENNKILGVLCAYASPQIFNNNKSIMNVFIFQALPTLSPIKKGRVISKLIKKINELSKKVNIDVISFGTMATLDMSSYFLKNNYKQGDIYFYKEVK